MIVEYYIMNNKKTLDLRIITLQLSLIYMVD